MIRYFFLTAILSFSLSAMAGKAAFERQNGVVTLKSSGAEYLFQDGGFFHMKGFSIDGRKLDAGKLHLAYLIRNGDWHLEDNPFPLYKTDPFTGKLEKCPDGVRFTVKGEGKNLTLTRVFELKDGDPSLFCHVRLDVRGENKIQWMNLFSCRLPADAKWIRLISEVRNGKLECKPFVFDKNPFLNDKGEFIVVGNYRLSQFDSVPLGGVYEPGKDAGFIFFTDLDRNRRLFRMGLNGDRKSGYLTYSPTNFLGETGAAGKESAAHAAEATSEGAKSFNEFYFRLLPFAGTPDRLKKIIDPFVVRLRQAGLIDDRPETGRLIEKNRSFALWQDFPDAKIFREEAVPEKKEGEVRLFSARGETESFQLALRPLEKLSGVTLRFSPLRSGKNVIASPQLQYHPVDYLPAARPWHPLFGMTGAEMPDTLNRPRPRDCAADKVQPFLIVVDVPENAVPGDYSGSVSLLSEGKQIASVPLKLKVWRHSLKERTFTAALDFWWRYKNYSKELQPKVAAEVEQLVASHRGGGRWVARPSVVWNPDGSIQRIDFSKFDESVRKFLDQYGHRYVIARDFMLGYGHVPQDGSLGKKEEILSPLWKKKLRSLAEAFSRHLKENQWNDKIVWDLFDEPLPQYAHMVNEVVTLLREVDPSWRFTLAGGFNPAYLGHINFWNINMGAVNRSDLDTVARDKGKITVYNPPWYRYNNAVTLCRGNYLWLFDNRIDYVYQWLVNCWADSGFPGWDDYLRSSWIVPDAEGALSTLRFNATRDGIEDFEALTLLRKESDRVAGKEPKLAAEGRKLLRRVSKLSHSLDTGMIVSSQNPEEYSDFHREVGTVLDRMAAVRTASASK